MLIENALVPVKPIGITLKHYCDLGYDARVGVEIMVKPSELTDGSKVRVIVECDVCHSLYNTPYKSYIRYHTYGMDTCPKCKHIKTKKTCIDKYGVDSPMKVDEIKEKQKHTIIEKYGVDNISKLDFVKDYKKKTTLEHYGVENPAQNKEIRDRQIQTFKEHYYSSDEIKNKRIKGCMDKYGVPYVNQSQDIQEKTKRTNLERYGVENVFQNKEIQEKIKSTNLQKYGSENPFANEEIKAKIMETNISKYGVPYIMMSDEMKTKAKETNIKKYGVENPLQNPEILAKMLDTLCKNGECPTSKQQLELFEIIKNKYSFVELNYPYSSCVLDIYICINNIKIDIEYDGWYWHQNQQRDIKRDRFLQSNGFKVLRIKSARQIPKEKEIFDAIDSLVKTDRIYKEIIMDGWKEVSA